MSSGRSAGLLCVKASEPLVVGLGARVARDEVPQLCEQMVEGLRATGATEVICDAGALDAADMAAVEALARLRLAARRAGVGMRIRDPDPRLTGLLDLVGLAELFREPEEREPPLGVEEAVEPTDPAV
ncbi:STAS domain-containing protein [Streptomyces cavernicola]|uniref:STAS domain-containing protein n=1 Tax=Streptomyces cavernicola TaxID=3043613 RepID=A0ABT6SN03_9ACTN|nr:STAS domain-containing protein [Streptomyces sp. B-S-A6]MDI3409309.1 STAS domain-containing protein [Streptomyces sp. B-S-A6]